MCWAETSCDKRLKKYSEYEAEVRSENGIGVDPPVAGGMEGAGGRSRRKDEPQKEVIKVWYGIEGGGREVIVIAGRALMACR